MEDLGQEHKLLERGGERGNSEASRSIGEIVGTSDQGRGKNGKLLKRVETLGQERKLQAMGEEIVGSFT